MKKKIAIVLIAGMVVLLGDYMSAVHNNATHIVKENGKVYLIRPDEGQSPGHVTVEGRTGSGRDKYEKSYDITIDPYEKEKAGKRAEAEEEADGEMSVEELRAYEMRNAVSGVNDDISARKIALPSHLSNGDEIYWSTHAGTSTIPVLLCMALACMIIYRNRQLPDKRRREAELTSIKRQLPEFTNKLVLLLNAGLVLNTAFDKSVEESLRFSSAGKRPGNEDYFLMKMKDIYISVRETNSSLAREFRAFARSSGAGELMRISNILSDNISKGVELTEKLQTESEVLWLNRKRDSEERGRMSETKLTMPLTLFLMVLIIITVSPALLEL